MPLKNTVAFERRIDLASLFCMIGRHGPAVVMAVLGMVCLVMSFIIYRTLRERWRRRAPPAEDRDSHAGQRGAALGPWEEEEPSAEEVRTSTGSTDTSDESSSDDTEEDVYLSHKPPKARLRRAAAKTQPHNDRDTSVAEKAFVWEINLHKPMGKITEDPYQSLESDFTNKTKAEEVRGMEPDVIDAVSCEKEEKVFETEECEDIVSTNQDISEEECRQAEHTYSNGCFNQTPILIIQEKETNTLETKKSNLEKREDVSVPLVGNKANEVDQSQNVPCSKCDWNIVAHPNDEKSSNLLQEVSNDYGTNDNVNVETPNHADRTDLPSNCQQQSESPASYRQIDQSGLCSQKTLHLETEDKNADMTSMDLEIPSSAASVDPSNQSLEQFELQDDSMSSLSLESGISSSPDVEVINEEIGTIAEHQNDKMVDQEDNDESENAFTVSSPSENILIIQNAELEFNKEEAEIADHQKNYETMDTEQPQIKQDTSLQCDETALPIQAAEKDNLMSDLKHNVEEELPVFTHNRPQDEVVSGIAEVGQSSNVASSHEDVMKVGQISSSTSDISSSSDTTKVSEEQQKVEQKEHKKTPHLDVEIVCPTLLLCHTMDPEIAVSGQKNKTGNESERLEIEINFLEDTKNEEDKQTTLKAEIEQQNPSLQHLNEDDVLQLKDSCDNFVSEALEEDAKKLEVIEEKQEGSEEIVDIQEETSMISSCPMEMESEDQTLSAVQTETENNAAPPDTKSPILDTNIDKPNTTEAADLNIKVITSNISEDVKSTVEASSVQVSSHSQDVSSYLTVKACDNSSTQHMIVTHGQIFAKMATDTTSPEPCDFKNEATEEESLSALSEREAVPEEHKKPLYNPSDIPNKTEAICQEGTFSVSAVEVSSHCENESSCQTNDTGTSLDMIAPAENICSFLEQNFDKNEVSDKFAVASNSAILSSIQKSEPEILSLNQELQIDIAKFSNMELEIACSATSVDPTNQSLDQFELKDNSMSSPGLESGISSITVSPDVEVVGEEISAFVVQSQCDHLVAVSRDSATTRQKLQSKDEYSHSLGTVNVVVTNVEETVTSGLIESNPVDLAPPEVISDECLVTNEDSFGSEIEDRYQKAIEEWMMQVVYNINISSDVKQIKDNKKEQVCAVKKGGAEKLKDEFEKTEISIMEATMDHNEWITDGNDQVLPWMNTSSFVKDNSKEPEIPQVVENKSEESTENAKKVLAVQPMPQNVNVTFRVHYLTLSPYQTVAVTGDQHELGSWNSVIPLEKAVDGYWSCVVSLPAESHVEWKFVVLDKGEVCRWEECGNRLLYTGYGDDLLVHRWWGFL